MIKKSMIGLLIVGFITASLLFTSSCQKKVEVAPGPTQAEIDAKKAADEAARKEAELKAKLAREEAEKKAADEQAQRDKEEAERIAAAAKAAMESEKVFFDFDSSELKPDAQEILTRKAAWLKANSDYKLRIEGNCDERGSTEYNMALGARRAEAASKFLTALGISSDRITTVSYGEEKPAVAGHNEAAWAQNRRDEFVLIQ